jgi:hypothetical protein
MVPFTVVFGLRVVAEVRVLLAGMVVQLVLP